MRHIRYFVLFLLLSTSAVAVIKTAYGFPASSFHQGRDGEWYDNWEIDRNNAGADGDLPGYLPNLASETLGENKELAYRIGQQFLNENQSRNSCAEAILKYVQTWTYYAYDSDTFTRNGVVQDEWAQNADEFAHAFNQTTGVKAPGDCEDMAFLCGTIYVGAGYDAAVIDATSHVGVLIWLPEYPNANEYWDLNDGRGKGWIWVEATGSSNPLGWTPSDFEDGQWIAYQINSAPQFTARAPVTSQSALPNVDLLFVVLVVILAIILVLTRLRGSH